MRLLAFLMTLVACTVSTGEPPPAVDPPVGVRLTHDCRDIDERHFTATGPESLLVLLTRRLDGTVVRIHDATTKVLVLATLDRAVIKVETGPKSVLERVVLVGVPAQLLLPPHLSSEQILVNVPYDDVEWEAIEVRAVTRELAVRGIEVHSYVGCSAASELVWQDADVEREPQPDCAVSGAAFPPPDPDAVKQHCPESADWDVVCISASGSSFEPYSGASCEGGPTWTPAIHSAAWSGAWVYGCHPDTNHLVRHNLQTEEMQTALLYCSDVDWWDGSLVFHDVVTPASLMQTWSWNAALCQRSGVLGPAVGSGFAVSGDHLVSLGNASLREQLLTSGTNFRSLPLSGMRSRITAVDGRVFATGDGSHWSMYDLEHIERVGRFTATGTVVCTAR